MGQYLITSYKICYVYRLELKSQLFKVVGAVWQKFYVYKICKYYSLINDQ